MTTVPSHTDDEKRYTLLAPADTESTAVNDKPPLLTCPLRIAEMAIEIQLEKLRVVEAMNARDVLVQKLSDAYTSIREKTELIERLQQALNSGNQNHSALSSPVIPWDQTTEATGLRAQVADLEALIQDLRIGSRNSMGPPPRYEEEEGKNAPLEGRPPIPVSGPQTISVTTSSPVSHTPVLPASFREERSVQTTVLEEPEDMVNARFAALASIPLPDNPPDDTLKPIVLPPACTLHDFLSSTSGALRNSLGNYRVLQSLTTKWCPSREEHGYFYSPLFKCSTNPRVTTAHRWQQVDVTARLKLPTECFYNREGLWYYAGSYQAFRLEDLTTKEWAELATETANCLVKETISGRKNVSPQNIYEVNQLYNAGALKIACVALQCVGFNREVYKAILEHAAKFSHAKWKTGVMSSPNMSGGVAITSAGGMNTGTGASGNHNKPANVSTTLSADISRPISPTVLGSTNTGFGVVTAGLGLGNGATWNSAAAFLALGNNQMILPSNGDENHHAVDGAVVGYRAGVKK